MTHLPFVAAAYALGIGIPVVLGLGAWARLRQVRSRLMAVDPRAAT